MSFFDELRNAYAQQLDNRNGPLAETELRWQRLQEALPYLSPEGATIEGLDRWRKAAEEAVANAKDLNDFIEGPAGTLFKGDLGDAAVTNLKILLPKRAAEATRVVEAVENAVKK